MTHKEEGEVVSPSFPVVSTISEVRGSTATATVSESSIESENPASNETFNPELKGDLRTRAVVKPRV